MEAYCEEVWRLEDKFFSLKLYHVAQWYKDVADELAKIALGQTTIPPNVFGRDIYKPSVIPREALEPDPCNDTPPADRPKAMQIDDDSNRAAPPAYWRTPYLEYLLQGELPLGKAEAQRLACRAKTFALIGEKELYRRSPSGILQQCIPTTWRPEPSSTMSSCKGFTGDHGRRCHQDRAVVLRLPILRETYAYASLGPTDDPNNLALHGVGIRPHRSSTEGSRGLYAPNGRHRQILQVDRGPTLANIKSEQTVAFFTDIIHRFGVPNSIITDNNTQFIGKNFFGFCSDHHIRMDLSAMAHPRSNRQVECANDVILQGLKPRIFKDLIWS
jgi:hypothetical protein